MLDQFKTIHGSGVPRCYQSFFTPTDPELCLVTEATCFTSGFDYSLPRLLTTRFPNGLPENVLVAVLKQLLTSIDAMHQCGVGWHDVRAKNIFLTSDGTVRVRWFLFILNLGCCRHILTPKHFEGKNKRFTSLHRS